MMLLVGRVYFTMLYSFTFRQAILNPAVAFGLQFFSAVQMGNFSLILSIWGLVVGEIIGALLAAYFYELYDKLLSEI